jgi:hypothetical protein
MASSECREADSDVPVYGMGSGRPGEESEWKEGPSSSDPCGLPG